MAERSLDWPAKLAIVCKQVNARLMFLEEIKSKDSLGCEWTHYSNIGSHTVSVEVQVNCCSAKDHAVESHPLKLTSLLSTSVNSTGCLVLRGLSCLVRSQVSFLVSVTAAPVFSKKETFAPFNMQSRR